MFIFYALFYLSDSLNNKHVSWTFWVSFPLHYFLFFFSPRTTEAKGAIRRSKLTWQRRSGEMMENTSDTVLKVKFEYDLFYFFLVNLKVLYI